jgi:multidrug efflux pump subunit AcrA (membrane-fusion protein)
MCLPRDKRRWHEYYSGRFCRDSLLIMVFFVVIGMRTATRFQIKSTRLLGSVKNGFTHIMFFRTLRVHIGLSSFLALSLLLLTACAKKQAAPQVVAPIPVTVATVEQRDVFLYGNWVATLDGFVNAQIQPQVSGYMIKQDYREGSVVQNGQVLFEIDPRPFQATVDQAEGQLAQARAQLELAAINVKRDTPLAQAHAIAQSQLDNDVQQQAAQGAAVRTSEANVEQARLNLGFTKVRSLVTGIAGRAQTQVGSLVSQSTTLTTVSQVNPIKVYFSISEQEYLGLSGRVKAGAKADLLRSGNSIPLQLMLGNGNIYPYKDQIVSSIARSISRQEPYRSPAAFRIRRTCCVLVSSAASRLKPKFATMLC